MLKKKKKVKWSLRVGWSPNRPNCNHSSILKLIEALKFCLVSVEVVGNGILQFLGVSVLDEDSMLIVCPSGVRGSGSVRYVFVT